jgi:hypothetical protein
MTHAEAMAHQARVLHQRGLSVEGGGVDKESELHREILDHCRRMGWIALHGSMAQATARTIGEWDFTILADRCRVFFVECKKKDGKLSNEQLGMIAWAEKLGHSVAVVRSIKEFYELCEDKTYDT